MKEVHRMEAKKTPVTTTGKKPGKYPNEIRTQAVEMFFQSQPDFSTRAACARHITDLLGIGTHETVMNWVRQAETDNGTRNGLTTDEIEEIRRLRRENAELKRANGILKAASAFFAAELDRPRSR
jgi:transposase